MTRAYKVAVLSTLYFNQGVPYGFFLLTLPILMRQQGASATLIGSLMFLALPWTAKVLWAPLVDRAGSRRAWVVSLQLGLAATLTLLAFTLVPWQLALGVLVVNFFIATQDIAVDGYAVRILATGERALGNSIQASFYKVGMLVGGGVLPALTLGADAATGWKPTLLWLAVLTVPALVAGVMLRSPEETLGAAEGSPSAGTYETEDSPTGGVGRVLQRTPSQRVLWSTLWSRPGAAWLFAFALFAKFGDNFGTGMFRVFLVDHGWGADRISMVVSTYGLVTSIAGSMLMVIPLRLFSRWQAFALAAGTQAVFLFGVACAALGWLDESTWTPLLVLEHFASGLVTTVLYTILMDHTPLELPGSGFTALSVLSTLGMGLGSFLGGVTADLAGFPATFMTAAALALIPIALLRSLDRSALLAFKAV